MPELHIDPEFEKVCPPLSDEEFRQLEENILAEGEAFTPIFTWQGAIVDGHHRFKILQKHPEVKYRVLERSFENRYDAIAWICNNQLGRRNLNELQRTALIGRQYEAAKQSHGSKDRFQGLNSTASLPSPQFGDLERRSRKTAHLIANQHGIGHNSVERAEKFVQGLDAAEEALPGIEREIMSGKIRPTKQAVTAIASAPPEERKKLAEALRIDSTKKKTAKEMHDMYKSIDAIAADQARPKDGIDYKTLLEIIREAANSFMSTCDFYFKEYPELLKEQKNKNNIIKAIQRLKKYLLKIEGD